MVQSFKQLACGILGHKRVRRHVRSDGSRWRCACDRCGIQLVKSHSGGTWMPLDRADRPTR